MASVEMNILLENVIVEDINSDKRKYFEQSPLFKAFLAGSISGTCSAVLFQPLDVVKTRLQSSNLATMPRHGTISMVGVMTGIIQRENITALWKGMTPSLTRCVPGVGLYFGVMHWMKRTFTEGTPSPGEAFVIGLTARSISGFCLIPITVIKTRFESNEYAYRGMGQALKKIYYSEGVRGLSSGLVPTLVRDAPFSGLYLLFYSQIKQSIPKELMSGQMAAGTHFGCGLVAGMLVSLITQPADVVKTKLQLYPGHFESTLHVLYYIHQKYGMKGYFKGLMPRMLRRTLIAAMAWTLYEEMTQSIGLK